MRARFFVLVAFAAGMLAACTDSTTSPDETPGQPDNRDTIPAQNAFVASDAVTLIPAPGSIATHGGLVEVSYVSVPSGALPKVVSARIRNVTTNGPVSAPITVFAGGFDPVAVSANAGDELEIALTDSSGVTTLAKTTVPIKRPPVIIRTTPPKGRTDVAIRVIPAIIFSEPIDAQTVASSVRLTIGGSVIPARVEIVAGSPWVVQIVPDAPLGPLASYEVQVTTGLRDLDGDALAAPDAFAFTTGPSLEFTGRIAFVSTREGAPNIYLANANGSGITRLTSGDKPAWSPDGQRIAYDRGRVESQSFPHGAHIRLINADGTGDTRLVDGMDAAWSPDGNRIAFVDSAGIAVINVDGSGYTRLIRHDVALRGSPGHYVGSPAWSPDGTRIAFEHGNEDVPQRIYVMNADGSQPRLLTTPPFGSEFAECTPSWSPDGASILLWNFESGLAETRAAGGDSGVLTTIYKGTFPGISCFAAPDWSPEASGIVFGQHQEDAGRVWRGRVYVVNRSGGVPHLLFPDIAAPANPSYTDRDPAWARRLQ